MKQVIQLADKPTLDKILEILQNSGASNDTYDKHISWLTHYESMGKSSFVYNDKDILHELFSDYRMVMNDTNVNKEAFEYIISTGSNVGEALSNIYGIDEVDLLKSLNTLDEVLSNETAMSAISNNEIATNLMADKI